MSDLELTQALEAAADRARFRYRRSVLAGKRVDATTVTLAGAPDGKSWVRGFDESREETAVWGTVALINATVEIDRRSDGSYEIVSVDWEHTVGTHGDAARMALQPRGLDETVPHSIPDIGLVPGRLEASTLGGLYVHTREFDYDGGRHLGGEFDGAGNFDATAFDESVSAYVPSSTGYVVWVRRYFDTSDASFHFAAGNEELFPSVAYLSEASIEDVAIPTGCYPLGAVALAYGQATVQGGRFASARLFLGKKEIEIRQIMTDGRGAPMTDGRGAFMIGSR